MTDAPRDYSQHNAPLDVIAKEAQHAIEKGGIVMQKFTCEQCHARQTIETPNVFHRRGKCEECGHVTTIIECGYMVVMPTSAEALRAILDALEGR